MNNQEKGLIYEKFVKYILINKFNKEVYLWNECPETILIENKLVSSHNHLRMIRKDIKEGHLHNHKDIGIDLILIDKDEICLIQAKNGYSSGVRIEDLAGIMMRNSLTRKKSYIFYTNSLSRNVLNLCQLSEFVSFFSNFEELSINNISNINFVHLPMNIQLNETKEITEIIPYKYQLEAYESLSNHFKENKRGILSLPCGCGKTYISYLISNNFSQIIIISPLREFANQNLKRFIEYGYNSQSLLVDTDGERNLDNIKEIIKKNKKLLISTTYKSMDLIKDCLDLFENVLFIIDEFHNLSKANINNIDNDIYKLLKSNHKIFFMSATPRIYDIENDEEEYDINDLFGEIVYKMDFKDAISNKYITDYRIWLPSIHENNEELNEEISVYDIEDDVRNRCNYLYSCILNNGSRKIIIYCKDLNDMNKMMDTMRILNDYYLIEIDIYGINCEASENYRKEILNKFANNNDKIQLLFNIRILNECIDIPSCDSIYISYSTHNKITTIQRINRSTRIDKNNPYKIANIYLWCDEYNEIFDILSSIKEYDDLFKDKIKINQIDFFNNRSDKDIEILNKDEKLLKDYIINIKEYKIYTFEERIKLIEDYIEENGELPRLTKDKDNNKLYYWIKHTKSNYKKNTMNINHRKIWNEFIKKYEDIFTKYNYEKNWYNNYKFIIDYSKEHNKLPNDNKYIIKWISHQKDDFKNNKGSVYNNKEYNKLWQDLMNKYPRMLILNKRLDIDAWMIKFNDLKDYLIINKILSIPLRKWYNKQINNYKQNKCLMEDINIRNIWKQFIEEYNDILNMSKNQQNWIENLNKLKEILKRGEKIPTRHNKDDELKSLGYWYNYQIYNYKNNKNILNNPMFRKKWEEFLNEYLN